MALSEEAKGELERFARDPRYKADDLIRMGESPRSICIEMATQEPIDWVDADIGRNLDEAAQYLAGLLGLC